MALNPKTGRLVCDGETGCPDEATMIDAKGFLYCPRHGLRRRAWCRCRKLRTHEIDKLKRGETLPRY